MERRNNIPVLAILGLSFTGCSGGDDKPDPIVGEWNAIQLDGDKLPRRYSEGAYTYVFGLHLTVEDDLAGHVEYYGVLDYGDFEYHYNLGTDLVVDDATAPKYRLELVKDLFGGGDAPYYDSVGYSTVGDPATSGDYTGGYIGDGDGSPTPELAAPGRPIVAPAELVLTCTLEQDVLTCAAEGESPTSLVFKRKQPVEPAGG